MPSPTETLPVLLGRHLKDWTPKLIFDVGANVGQSAKAYARAFPDARIHCFEPAPETHVELAWATAALPNVVTHCLALGREAATRGLLLGKRSTTNRLAPADAEMPPDAILVPVRTGAELFHEVGGDRIDLLKIDTEGHDLHVLQGFAPVIDRIDLIQVEAGMTIYNKTHVPFARLDRFLRDAGFHLFHIFEQKMEWKRSRPVLRRCNPVYISQRLVDLQSDG